MQFGSAEFSTEDFPVNEGIEAIHVETPQKRYIIWFGAISEHFTLNQNSLELWISLPKERY